MKPTKNKIFCVACKRPKMLFESKSKADNFMKYNAGEILEENGKAPVHILDGMRTDDNTSMLRNQLANWKMLLGEDGHGNDNTTLS